MSYNGVPTSEVDLVWDTIAGIASRDIDIQTIVERTGTQLDLEIISIMVDSAARMLPVPRGREANIARRANAVEKAIAAQFREDDFLTHLSKLGFWFYSEAEQREVIRAAQAVDPATPAGPISDALFQEPQEICGVSCKWIEYKNTFGFRRAPYSAPLHLAQYRRYINKYGPGAVVYRFGFECDLVDIPGIHCFREAEVRQWIDAQVSGS